MQSEQARIRGCLVSRTVWCEQSYEVDKKIRIASILWCKKQQCIASGQARCQSRVKRNARDKRDGDTSSCNEKTSMDYQRRDRNINDPSQYFEYNEKANNDVDGDNNGAMQRRMRRETKQMTTINCGYLPQC